MKEKKWFYPLAILFILIGTLINNYIASSSSFTDSIFLVFIEVVAIMTISIFLGKSLVSGTITKIFSISMIYGTLGTIGQSISYGNYSAEFVFLSFIFRGGVALASLFLSKSLVGQK